MDIFKKLRFLFTEILRDERGWTAEMSVTGISEIDAAIPEYWVEGIIKDGDRESFWGQLTGKEGSMMPVIVKTGKLKENGNQLNFNTIQQLMGSGVTGESVLKGTEEKMGIGTFTVTADYVRHAVAITKKAQKQGNFDQVKMAGVLLKQWITRKFDNDAFSALTGDANIETLYANSKTSAASLNATDGDVFGVAEIEQIRLALIRQGALPLQETKVNGRTTPMYGIVFGEIEEYNLSQNNVFCQTIREALARFQGKGDHPMFRGAIGMYRNMILYPYYSLLPIPQGTPLRPETTIYATLTTTATVLSVGGATASSGSGENYTLFFASSGSLQIEDEIISYTSLTVNTFAGLTRGVSSTTAVQHSAGKLVTQRNVATVLGFGAEAIFKAIPEDATPIGENDDYGAQIGIGIEAYYGQKAKIDKRRGKVQNAVMMKVYSKNPGTV